MNGIYKTILLIFTAVAIVSSCSDWVMPENIVIQDLTGTEKSEEYYADIRAFKKTDHQISFGWFGFWNGGTSTSARGSLRSLPDSLDIVSIWGDKYNLSQNHIDDMRYVQEKLGTRVTFTLFSHNMSNLFKGGVCPFPNEAEYIPQAAKALADSIAKYGYDGIDFDHECSGNDLFYNKDNMTTLLREMRKNIGPDKLIMVDGHLNLITEEGWSYCNYAISQAYNTTGPSKLDSRFNAVKKYIRPEQFIVTENFESYWKNGGVNYTDKDGNKMPSLLGMAHWQPDGIEGHKGGCGAYHMEYEYVHNPEYKWLRKAIQIMNPAKTNPDGPDNSENQENAE